MSVYSVNVYPDSTTIQKGSWYYGAYAVVNASSSCNTDVTWYSNNTNIATVNASSGYIYGKAAGTARIYAQSTVDSSKKDYITVTVTSGTIYVNSVCLNRNYLTLENGASCHLTTTVCPSNASDKGITWSSSNPSVATVSGGTVHAVGVGSTTITARAQDGSNEYDTCYVNVTGNTLVNSVTVSPSSKTLSVGQSSYLYETVYPANATNKCVRWSSNDTNVATVNPDTGLVMAQGAGSATITAAAQDGSGKHGSCSVTVSSPISVTGVSVCPTNLTMNVGDIEYLCASITPSNATNQTVTWCSSNENVATVGLYTGRISANMAGSTTITATTVDGGFTASCTIFINQALTYPDTLITHNETRQKIVKLKTLIDENQKAYLEGKISICTKEIIEDQLSTECNVVRADYIVVGDNPTSNYAYAILGGNTNAPYPFSFANNLTLNSTGLAVIVVQRALEIMGYYEPKDSKKYGMFDANTYDSACSYSTLMSYDHQTQKYVFDHYSFNVLFQASTKEERTFNAFTELNKFKTVHNIVAQWSAGKVGGTYKMSDNRINNGNSAENYYGYADVLKDTGADTYIWEVKPDKERYYRIGGIGDRQLQRYLYAGNAYEQPFSKPLVIGYNIGSYTIPFLFNKYINVRNLNNPVVSTDARNGLILYKVEDTSKYSIETVPVVVEEPSESYDYNYSYGFNTSTWGSITVIGMAVVLGAACIALAGPSGGTSFVPLTLLVS